MHNERQTRQTHPEKNPLRPKKPPRGPAQGFYPTTTPAPRRKTRESRVMSRDWINEQEPALSPPRSLSFFPLLQERPAGVFFIFFPFSFSIFFIFLYFFFFPLCNNNNTYGVVAFGVSICVPLIDLTRTGVKKRSSFFFFFSFLFFSLLLNRRARWETEFQFVVPPHVRTCCG